MTKPRIPETDNGIQGELTVAAYDEMQRSLRDRGWIETPALIKAGITRGVALEIGPGPGYLGLEWLKCTAETTLKGVDISPDMLALAERNARQYGLAQRVEYVHGVGDCIPFPDAAFDAVFTNGSLHEWENPRGTFDEIHRVLKPGGIAFISDLRRDMLTLMRWFLWLFTQPKEIRPGLNTSLNAAYTPQELRQLIRGTRMESASVSGNLLGVWVEYHKSA